jgi:phosphoglycerate kinase
MDKMTVRDIDVNSKKVLVRVDFNVPMDKDGRIMDDSRIRASLPTIKYLLDRKAKIILLSHIGRPKGKVVEDMRLAPVAGRLSQILGKKVETTADCIGPEVEKTVSALKLGSIIMLENLRFHNEEEAGDVDFAKSLAKLGDVYVNDAFGTSHRAHASISVIAQFLPAVAGFLLEKEITTLGGLLEKPDHPFTAVFGGAKVSDKVAVLKNILGKVNVLLIGGGMAGTFLKVKKHEIGKSLMETESLGIAADLIKLAESAGVKLVLPVDAVVTDTIDVKSPGSIVQIDKVPPEKMIADIGPRTIELFSQELKKSKTVFWNGPMGVEEIPQFARGTEMIAHLLVEIKAKTIIGGGSTSEVVDKLGLADKMTFVSTGGGASMEFLGGDILPGVAALLDKK